MQYLFDDFHSKKLGALKTPVIKVDNIMKVIEE
jgi:hypothetical protein